MKSRPTIYALSSGKGPAGIAIVRVSGGQARHIVESLAGALPVPRKLALRRIVGGDGDVLDCGLVAWFPSPNTATGEDMAEFHVHGGPAVVAALLQALSAFEDCRLADPGEFTRRAFDAGKLDLLEVEGLADLLAASTEGQRRLALRQFMGGSGGQVAAWWQVLLRALALVEAAIDFSEEDDVAMRAVCEADEIISGLRVELEDALVRSREADCVRSGLRIVIAGPPNVGKSSLLNALARQELAIVSPLAGTTRDIVETGLVLEGVRVSLYDTAGLREAAVDAVELEGMRRARKAAHESDILVWVDAIGEGEEVPPRKPDLHVLNKIDLIGSIHVRNELAPDALSISTRVGTGLSEFRLALAESISRRSAVADDAVLVRERHRVAVTDSIRHLNDSLIRPLRLLELKAQDIRNAARALTGVTGGFHDEDVLGEIFSSFCIGK